jgi:hypothetical protein
MQIAPGTERPRQLAGFSNAPEATGHQGERLPPDSGDLRASSRSRQARAGGHGQRDVTSPKSGRFGLIGRYAYSSGVGAIDHVCAVPVWRITEFR